jgi:hypothetical protein
MALEWVGVGKRPDFMYEEYNKRNEIAILVQS